MKVNLNGTESAASESFRITSVVSQLLEKTSA